MSPSTSVLEIVYRSPAELRPDPRNARTHPKTQVEQIATAISTWGFTNPILIDETDLIIAGHGRLLAARTLHLDSVPTIQLSGLSEASKRALRLADNKIALGSSWDTDLLRAELAAISELEATLDLTVTGFTAPEIDIALLARSGLADDAAIPSPPARPVTRPGDIWQLGPHRLGCGDCRDEDFLAKVMDGCAADAAFLDPPYNVKISGFAVAKGKHGEFKLASGEMTPAEFTRFLIETLGACAGISRPGAVHFCAMDWRHMAELLSAAREVYSEQLNLCVWNKTNGGMGCLYRSKHELIGVFKVGTGAYVNAVELGKHGRNRSNVWDYSSVTTFNRSRRAELDLHPTVKPAQLVADALMDVSRRGDVVLDGFCGSGTTLLAAERTGRRFRGVEIDPGYVDVAVERWMQITGSDAILADTGETFRTLRLRQLNREPT
jgi:DNA modification methylase